VNTDSLPVQFTSRPHNLTFNLVIASHLLPDFNKLALYLAWQNLVSQLHYS